MSEGMITKIKIFLDFLTSMWSSRKMIGSMVINDFKVKYASSALGIVWAFIQPTVQILVLVYVFTYFIGSGATDVIPRSLFLVCGIVPWNFFADALNNGTNSLAEYSYLVKKVVFRTSILPVVKTLSSMIIHAVFVVIAFIVALYFGYYPTLYTLQLLYYIPCLLLFVIGLNWLSSAFAAFFKDISQLINVILQIFVWLTPILYDSSMLEGKALHIGSHAISLARIFKLNPMYYIVDGYRDSFYGKVWFWEKPLWTIYFLAASSFIFFMGASVFHKLRPHFSDVL